MQLPVIALPDKPVKSSGGPSRIGYELLKSLVGEGHTVRYLNLATRKVHRLSSLEELEMLSSESYPQQSRFRRKASIWLAAAIPGALDWARAIRYRIAGHRIALHLQGSNPAFLHIHGMSPILAFVPFGDAKIIWSEHSKGSLMREIHMLHGQPPRGTFATALERSYTRLLNEASMITFPSWGAVQLFEEYTGWEVPKQKLQIVYNGIPDPLRLYQEISNVKLEDNLVVTVAQHVPEKGLDLAYKALAESGRPWRWQIIGERTSWTERLRELIRRQKSTVKVEMLGQLTYRQTLALQRKAQVVLATQRVAVFDLVILEAMALGKLVVATRVGGNVEALGADYPFLGQSVEDIAELLQKVYDDPDVAEQIGQRNRERYLTLFTLDAMINSYKELYKGIHV